MRIIGSAVFSYFSAPSRVELYTIKVLQNMRYQGLGSAIFQYIVHKKYPAPIDHIELDVSPSDYQGARDDAISGLLSFYSKQGKIQKIGRSPNRIHITKKENS